MALAVVGCVGSPRIVARGATYAVTRRCVLRKSFLGWWDAEVDRIWLWCLALACAKTGAVLHHAVRVGSHYHLTVTLVANNLGDFLWWLNHNLSCALNTLLAKRGYDAPGQLFDGRQTHVMRLLDAEAQMLWLLYERGNVVRAGLAETCDGIPGVTLDPGLWKTGGRLVELPQVYFREHHGLIERPLVMGPAPLHYLAFGGDVDALVHHQRVLEREYEQRIRAERKGRPARTKGEVRAIHPYDEPMTLREPGGGLIPAFKTGLGPEARKLAAVEVTEWRRSYHEAEKKWRAGDRDVEMPYGTHLLATRYHANVAEPHPDAWVSAPGPTLEEAKAMVGERDETLVDRVREKLDDVVVAEVDEVACDDGETEAGDEGDDDAGAVPERDAPVTLHRFSKRRPTDPADHPSRLIFHRDAHHRARSSGDPPED